MKTSSENIQMKSALKNVKSFDFADLKLANEALGLGTCASRCPCPYCESSAETFHLPNVIFEGGTLRSFRRISQLAEEYQKAKAKSRQKTKFSSAQWANCEKRPLCIPYDGEEDVLVIDCLAPMELHLLLGIFHYLYNGLDQYLALIQSPIKIQAWGQALGFDRSSYWASYNGKYIDIDTMY